MSSVMITTYFLNELALLHLKYVIKICIMHVMHWGKHGETWEKLLCFPENDKHFLNNTADIWNVETCITTTLLHQNHMKTSSTIHMYHYSLSSVHKLLTDLIKWQNKQNKLNTMEKKKTNQPNHYLFTTCTSNVCFCICTPVCTHVCICVCRYVCF
jgi:hypothetical protein